MTRDIDDLVQWLCWMWAEDGERFYPPTETAWECVEHQMEQYEDKYDDDTMLALALIRAYEWEYGQHSRACSEAHAKFSDLESWGFDPVELAAREHRDLMEQANGEVEPLDWSWYHGE
jgi:hypothetical protein